MPELGDTTDPLALVPGDPAALFDVAWSLRTLGESLEEAGGALVRLGLPEGWQGVAAEEFRARFAVEPQRWVEAGACHSRVATSVEVYAEVLQSAQRQAADAVARWEAAAPLPSLAPPPPGQQEALALLADARARVQRAGDAVAASVAADRDAAPEGPGFVADLAAVAQSAGAEAGNAAASLANAALRHPLDGLAIAGGGLLAGVSAAGVAGGVGLTATGPGALAGVPLTGLSTVGVAAGASLAGLGAIDLALHAAGPDRVTPFRVDQDEPSGKRAPRTALGERIASVGEPGRRRFVRQLESDEAVRELWDEIGADGEPLDRPGYAGRWVTAPDGTEIGFREESRSSGPTIDIVSPNGEAWKIHRR